MQTPSLAKPVVIEPLDDVRAVVDTRPMNADGARAYTKRWGLVAEVERRKMTGGIVAGD
jgi:hypothetical protein